MKRKKKKTRIDLFFLGASFRFYPLCFAPPGISSPKGAWAKNLFARACQPGFDRAEFPLELACGFTDQGNVRAVVRLSILAFMPLDTAWVI